jgi:hypothetical protein
MIAHIYGIPIEENAAQIASAAATATVVGMAVRTKLGHLLGRIRRR